MNEVTFLKSQIVLSYRINARCTNVELHLELSLAHMCPFYAKNRLESAPAISKAATRELYTFGMR